MDWSAPHLAYVLAAYAASFIVLAALALRIIWRDRRMTQDLRKSEARRERQR